jgi:hypothetical protein
LGQARRFLSTLDPEAEAFCFQTFDDSDLKRGTLAKVINGSLDEEAHRLDTLNTRGAGVFVTINVTDGTGRKTENITRARAVFADLDGAPLGPVNRCALTPHIVVESSRRRFHAYWLTEAVPLDEFEPLQKAIAARFGGDPSVHDLPRVMRLPGFLHKKREPFQSRIVELNQGLPYSAEQLLAEFPPVQDDEPPRRSGAKANPDSPFAKINEAALANLDAWVPELFPTAKRSAKGWRVGSADLGRGYEEDLSIIPQGAKYFGIHDQGDARQGKRTPIDLVIEYGGKAGPASAARWLADKLGIEFGAPTADQGQPEVDLDQLIEKVADDPGAAFEGETIDFLARLRATDPAAYERARARLRAKKVRVGELDKEVERRAPAKVEATTGQGRALSLPEIEPWPEAAAGDALLAAMAESLRRFVVLPDHAASAVVLWVLHCHVHDAAFHSPRLAITSPVMRCGKSSLLRWLARVVPKPLPTSNISAAALFRVIEAAYPTLLIDELDQQGPDKKIELVGIINSSHCRLDAQIIRTVGDQHEPRAFSTWAPMALAAIGKLPFQWVDRSIVVEMTRKLTADRAEGMRLDRDQGFEVLRRKAARWAQDHLERLRGADPKMPPGLNDRQQDNWRLLLAIANAVGGQWPQLARSAATALSKADDDAEARGVQALTDIRQTFEDRRDPDFLTSEIIVTALIGMEGRPWAEYRQDGKPITKHALARLLKPFGIAPGNASDASAHKGYKRDSFAIAWAKYIQTADPLNTTESAAHSDFQTADQDEASAVSNRPKPAASKAFSGSAVSNPPPEAEDEGVVI